MTAVATTAGLSRLAAATSSAAASSSAGQSTTTATGGLMIKSNPTFLPASLSSGKGRGRALPPPPAIQQHPAAATRGKLRSGRFLRKQTIQSALELVSSNEPHPRLHLDPNSRSGWREKLLLPEQVLPASTTTLQVSKKNTDGDGSGPRESLSPEEITALLIDEGEDYRSFLLRAREETPSPAMLSGSDLLFSRWKWGTPRQLDIDEAIHPLPRTLPFHDDWSTPSSWLPTAQPSLSQFAIQHLVTKSTSLIDPLRLVTLLRRRQPTFAIDSPTFDLILNGVVALSESSTSETTGCFDHTSLFQLLRTWRGSGVSLRSSTVVNVLKTSVLQGLPNSVPLTLQLLELFSGFKIVFQNVVPRAADMSLTQVTSVRTELFYELLATLKEAKQWSSIVQLYEWTSSREHHEDFLRDVRSLKIVIVAIDNLSESELSSPQNSLAESLLDVFPRMFVLGYHPPSWMLLQIASIFVRSGKTKHLFVFLDEVFPYLSQNDGTFYISLIRKMTLFSNTERLSNEAIDKQLQNIFLLLQWITQKKQRPTLLTFASAFLPFGEFDQLDRFHQLSQGLSFQPTRKTYQLIIDVLQRMLHSGVELSGFFLPTASAHSTSFLSSIALSAVSGGSAVGESGLAKEMRQFYLEAKLLAPRAEQYAYNLFIRSSFDENQFQEVLQAYDSMLSSNLKPDFTAHVLALSVHLQNPDSLNSVLRTYDAMVTAYPGRSLPAPVQHELLEYLERQAVPGAGEEKEAQMQKLLITLRTGTKQRGGE